MHDHAPNWKSFSSHVCVFVGGKPPIPDLPTKGLRHPAMPSLGRTQTVLTLTTLILQQPVKRNDNLIMQRGQSVLVLLHMRGGHQLLMASQRTDRSTGAPSYSFAATCVSAWAGTCWTAASQRASAVCVLNKYLANDRCGLLC